MLAFVTNRSFIESRTFDGFRKAVAQEFNEIHIVDLGGDVRANPKLSGTKNNVFGIQTGVAISFFVKRHKQKGCKIFYARRPEYDTAEDKLSFLANAKASTISYQRVEPDKNANWVNLTENDWGDMIPVAGKSFKKSSNLRNVKAIFGDYSMGYITARDGWVVGDSEKQIEVKVRYLIDAANLTTGVAPMANSGASRTTTIKWSRSLLRSIASGNKLEYEPASYRETLYRRFSKKLVYFWEFSCRNAEQDAGVFQTRPESVDIFQ